MKLLSECLSQTKKLKPHKLAFPGERYFLVGALSSVGKRNKRSVAFLELGE